MKILAPEPRSLVMSFTLAKAVQCELNALWLVPVLYFADVRISSLPVGGSHFPVFRLKACFDLVQ